MPNIKEELRRLDTYIEAHQEEMVRFLTEFIAKESVTYHEQDAARFLKGKMEEFGFDEVRVDKVGNVLGRVGSGKTVLLYDAHIDTVEPGDAADWGFDPLCAKIEDGVIHGRGAVDDKGPLTAAVFAARAIKELGLDKTFTMWVSGSLSEEDVEGSAVQAMMLSNADIHPDYVIIAECSSCHIMRGHKGRALIRITVPGKCAHGSEAWRGDNALVKALPIIDGIDKLKFAKKDPVLGGGTIEVTDCECFAPSHNTIPGKVIITCDRRIACGESVDDLLEDIKPLIEKIPGVTVEIDTEHVKTYQGYDITCQDYFPSWILEQDHPLVSASVEAYESMFGGETAEVGVMPCCTNATHFCGRLGIPSIVFGPGELADCHSVNDRVAIKDLLKAVKFYAALPLFAADAK